MKKTAKAVASLAAITLTAGLTARQGKGASKELVIEETTVTNFTHDATASMTGSFPKFFISMQSSKSRRCKYNKKRRWQNRTE